MTEEEQTNKSIYNGEPHTKIDDKLNLSYGLEEDIYRLYNDCNELSRIIKHKKLNKSLERAKRKLQKVINIMEKEQK